RPLAGRCPSWNREVAGQRPALPGDQVCLRRIGIADTARIGWMPTKVGTHPGDSRTVWHAVVPAAGRQRSTVES
ncbi:hypothetical protein MOQ50_11430, partial [Stenotrophomonas maltophilia]|nr:hypothetical protein [Stenotrophomonas maltophilia]